jgi:hypothetical protein
MHHKHRVEGQEQAEQQAVEEGFMIGDHQQPRRLGRQAA